LVAIADLLFAVGFRKLARLTDRPIISWGIAATLSPQQQVMSGGEAAV
jgi:hypothetical protein